MAWRTYCKVYITEDMLPFFVQITTAAITTTQDGNVYDVFQVKLDDDHASWTAQDVQCQVHSNLYSNFLAGSGDKRRRLIGV